MPSIYQTKVYLNRLWKAIRGKEFTEPNYIWGLDSHFLDLLIKFIDSERSGYPASYEEHAWEKKLKGIKIDILRYEEIEYSSKEEELQEIKKLKKKIPRSIADVFWNLWD